MNLRNYFEIGAGKVPIVLSCPHGGFKKPRAIPDRKGGVIIPDRNTYIIANYLIQSLKRERIDIYHVLNKVHRCKIDLNRPPRSKMAFSQNSETPNLIAQELHSFFHRQIRTFSEECVATHGKCLFMDLHGFTKPQDDYPDIIFGNIFGNSLTIKEAKEYWGFSQLREELSRNFTIDDGLGLSNFNLGYSGGYITYQFVKKNRINAFQIEIAKHIRLDLNLIQKLIESIGTGIKICLGK